jgi:glycosyltransferase involved in cell wall biosynthesis
MKKKVIKILFIAHSSEIGGAEKSLVELIKGLLEKDIVCHVAIPASGALAEELNKISVSSHIIYLPWCADGEKKYDHNRIIEIEKSSLDVMELIRSIKPDIVYSNSSVILQGAIASKILGIKHIWHIREFGELDYDIDYYLPIEKRAEFIFENSDKIIFISKALADYYHKYISDKKSEVVYNNVKISDSLENCGNKNNEKLELLMVGNIHPAKGQLDAVKAIKLLKDRDLNDIVLRIVGRKSQGYYKEIADFVDEYHLNDQICFSDFIPNPAKFFKESDIVLMCSKSEGFGRVTVEAMLFGKPVIGAYAGGTKEIIRDNENGLFYESGNPTNLAEKIMFFYDNRKKIAEYGMSGKAYCKNTFSEKKYIGRINQILLEVEGGDSELLGSLISKIFYKYETSERLLKEELLSTKRELNGVYMSREWKTAVILQKIVKMFFPKGSLRRGVVFKIFKYSKFLLSSLIKLKRKAEGYLLLFYDFFRPKKRRSINKKSKKIIFVAHSYHEKTKSYQFLHDYLKKFYDLELIFDDSWLEGCRFPDLSFIDNSYLAVIFWQNTPSKEDLNKIKNDNIIFFPMYDAVFKHSYKFWHKCRNMKIVCFSKTLHDKLKRWHLDSMYIQYFPETHSFIQGEERELFFWQRLSKININVISRMFSEDGLKIHIHRAIDPGQQFVQPNSEQEKKFQITYSDWFKTREEMWDLIKQKGIYIAPREYEGIGMSFLEAMAMGKAVVAVNNPTMNEYIEDGKNGYLFDLNKPKKIDLKNMVEVQKNAYEYMCKGFEKWEKEKCKIIEFIGKE